MAASRAPILPMSPWLPWRFSWPLPPYARQSASWSARWSPRGSSGAPEGSCRLGRAAPPGRPSGAVAPARARFPLAPAPARPRPICALTRHRRANGMFPPGRKLARPDSAGRVQGPRLGEAAMAYGPTQPFGPSGLPLSVIVRAERSTRRSVGGAP